MGQKEVEYITRMAGKDCMNLERTKTCLDIWKGLLENKKYLDKLPELEQIIKESAECEWGKNTRVKFDRNNKSARISNYEFDREIIWI